MRRILIVEDDVLLSGTLAYNLRAEGYEVAQAFSCAEARQAVQADVVLLDVNLPDGDGRALCAHFAESYVIFLTANDTEQDMLAGYAAGGADYVTKPFRLRELLARIRRALPEESSLLSLGQARIDTASGRVTVGGREIALTALEYRLCLIFAQHRGQLLSRAQILDQLWDQGGNFVEDNTLTVYVKRLREKLAGAVTIETVRGRGYRVDQ